MSTKDEVARALKKLEQEIALSVASQDGPKKITAAVEELIEVKVDLAVSKAALMHQKAKDEASDKQKDHKNSEEKRDNDRYLALQTEEREIIKTEREDKSLAERIKKNND